MARRPYVAHVGDLSGWPKGFVPTPAHLRRLDQYSSELVNGEDGGSWSPIDPIVIGAHDVTDNTTISFTNGASRLTGNVETVKGNSNGDEVATPGIILSTGSLSPVCQTARSRSVLVSPARFVLSNDLTRIFNHSANVFFFDARTGGVRGKIIRFETDFDSSYFESAPTTSHIITVPLPQRAMHRAATISSVVFRVMVVGQFLAVPATPMKFRVIRQRDTTMTSLHSAGGGYDADGWLSDTAATIASYVNGGAVREFTYTPDQNNTNLDPSQDHFFLQMRPSSDFRTSIFLPATVNLTSIADLRQE